MKQDITDQDPIFVDEDKLGKKVGEGTFVEVFDTDKDYSNDKDYVIKVGSRSSLTLPLTDSFDIELDRKKVGKMLKLIFGDSMQIMPTDEMIREGLAEYALIREYFAGGDEVEQRDALIKGLEDHTDAFTKEVCNLYGSGKDQQHASILESIRELSDENFLPQEKTKIGYPPGVSKEDVLRSKKEGSNLKTTYYIFQEKVGGKDVIHLSDLTDEMLEEHRDITKKLLLFALLTKKMYRDTGKLIDTRPEGIMDKEWFQNTANVVVDLTEERIYFIDTRFLWDKEMNILGEKHLNIVEQLGVKSVDSAIQKYANILSRSRSL